MKHVQQPKRTSVCGQSCVAMLAGVTLDEAVAACSRKWQKTSEHDLRRGLRSFGLDVEHFIRSLPRRDGRFLVRVRFAFNPNGYHWVVVVNSFVHDPSFDGPSNWAAYQRYLRRLGGRMTSSAQVCRRRGMRWR